jgi:hypothetical protein
MRQTTTIALFFLFISATFAQNLSVAEAREDLQYFRKKMEAWCPSIGYYQPAQRFEKSLDSLVQNIIQPIDYQQFYQKILPIHNTLQDGHFGIYHKKKRSIKTLKLLPFYPKKADGKFWVWMDITPNASLPRGTELIRLNGQPFGELFDFLCTKFRIGNDGPEDYGATQQVQNNFVLFYSNWFGSQDSVELTYKLTDTSQVMTRKFACELDATLGNIMRTRKKSPQKSYPNMSLEIVDSLPKTAVLNVSSFSGIGKYDVFGIRFRKRAKKAFRIAQERGIENLIIDLRNNGGGAVSNCESLLRYLLKERFELVGAGTMKKRAIWPYSGGLFGLPSIWFFTAHRYDKNNKVWHNRKHKKPIKKPIKTYHYDKKVYFLTNGGCFSGGAATPALARSHGVGTFVGEPTGGAYLGCFGGRYKYIKLPNSKILVRIPLKQLDYAVDIAKSNGVVFKPDFLVARSGNDIKMSRDAVMEYVFGLIKQRKL